MDRQTRLSLFKLINSGLLHKVGWNDRFVRAALPEILFFSLCFFSCIFRIMFYLKR